eukprot:1560598-Rhodomonas_salina.2
MKSFRRGPIQTGGVHLDLLHLGSSPANVPEVLKRNSTVSGQTRTVQQVPGYYPVYPWVHGYTGTRGPGSGGGLSLPPSFLGHITRIKALS